MESFEPTSEQRRVIEHRGRHVLVFAGPGTGKTETLARRFASIVHDDGIAPDAILVLTFSRRAALGMRKRIVQRMRERSGGAIAVPELHVYTFHGFCKRLLDGDGRRSARRDLLTPVKERLIWNGVIDGLELTTFAPDVVRSSAFATAVLNLIARLKGDGVTPDAFAAQIRGDARLADIAKLYRLMDEERTRRGLADFRDLVVDAVAALGDARSPASAWLAAHKPFRHVLVDEFQDSDPMQVRLLEAFGGAALHETPPTPQMCFVGDFNQSIYRFRGAAPENIVEAKDRFRCEELTLRLNRRSVQAVLDVANRTPFLHEESLTSADPANDRHGSVRLIQVETAADEVSAIGDAVATRIRDGAKPSDVAVLLRVVEPYRSAITRELEARGILVAAQSSTGFHDDALVGAVLSSMSLLADEHDAAEWRRLLTNPLIGFRPLTVSLALASDPDAAQRPRPALDAMPPSGRRDWKLFATRLDACRPAGGAGRPFDPAALIQTLVRELDLLWPLRENAEVPAFDASASPARLSALLQAAHDIRDVVNAGGRARLNIRGFLDALDELMPLLGDANEGPRPDENGVPVMSIHAAKGLEFDMVVIPQLIDGVLPTRARPDPLFGDRPTPYKSSAEANAVEEASLWYVALTRARYDVLATAARLGDEAAEQPLSAFAAAIPVEPLGSVAGRNEHVGFATAFEAAGATERHSAPVMRYLADRPVLDAFLRAQDLRDQRAGPVVWPLERLSPSGIEMYVACPRRWFYRHALQLEADDADATRMGRFVHVVLERYHTSATDFASASGRARTAEEIFAALEPIAEEEARLAAAASGLTVDAPLFRYEAARIKRQLAGYARWLAEEARARPFTVLACEHRVEIPLPSTRLVGYVDRVDRLGDGTLAIRDYKTGKNRWSRGSAQIAADAIGELDASKPGIGLFADAPDGLKLQTYLYVRAVQAGFASRVSRADYLYLGGSDKDREEIDADTTLFEDNGRKGQLSADELDRIYDVLVSGIAAELSEGRIAAFVTAAKESACGLCGYKQICPGPGTIDYANAVPAVANGSAAVVVHDGPPPASADPTAQLTLPLDGSA